MLENYLTVGEAAPMLFNSRTGRRGVSVPAVYQLIKRGALLSTKKGRTHLIHKQAIEERNGNARRFYSFHDSPSRSKS